ncbi:MAG TPA: hypothetical protein VLU38_00865 [Methanomassiliicoccales archaeon]|nr:hypothetical protein [Methanomassiliicoccales archaeon]
MTRVRVGKHLFLNVSRRSLCDSCVADVCVRDRAGRILECQDYQAVFLVFKRCSRCGELFEVHHNLCALDPELCPSCNALATTD